MTSDNVLHEAGRLRVSGEPLPWQRTALSRWLEQKERWPHAILLTGVAGIGKRVLAGVLARALLCETPRADGSACGTCASCRYAEAGQHPDLRVVEPVEIDDEGNVTPTEWIGIDTIRSLIAWTQLTSHRRGAKVAVISPAERMFPAAADALLKTLEEPPLATHLILVSDQPGRLLPTIASRCLRWNAPLPDVEAAQAWLEAQGVRDPASVLAQAGGAPLAALMLASTSLQAERNVWLAALASPRTMSASAVAARIDQAPREDRKAHLADVIDWISAWCTDLARVAAGSQPRHNPDQTQALAKLGKAVALRPLFRYHRAVIEQRAQLAHPLQPRLVAEALLIDYQTLFA